MENYMRTGFGQFNEPNDEFLIFACDGIWDCKTNQEAIDFVRPRLLEGMSCADISQQMLDECVGAQIRHSTCKNFAVE